MCGYVAASKDECLFNNFKVLFSRPKQQFVYDIMDMTKGKDGSNARGKALQIDGHGDNVLDDWNNCKKCPVAPCRAPFLTKITAGSNDMTRMLNEFVTIVKKEQDEKMFKRAKKVVDQALEDNKKALNC